MGHKPSNTIRLSSSRRGGKTLYVFMFGLTALAVYLWGNMRARRAPESFAATASVVRKAIEKSGESARPVKADLEAAKKQITAEANLKEVIRRVRLAQGHRPDNDWETALDEAVLAARRNLTISKEEAPPGTAKISLTYADQGVDRTTGGDDTGNHDTGNYDTGNYASRLVNELAESYADHCRAPWKTDTHKIFVKARDSLAEAYQAYLQAKARKDVFLASKAKELGVSPTDSPQARQFESPTPQQLAPAPHENPQWTALSDKLALLGGEKEQLLATRTALHPEVEDVQLRIDDLKLKLADMPRWLVPEDAEPVAEHPAEEEIENSDERKRQRAEAEKMLAALEQEVERTGKAYDRAAAAEHQTWQEHLKNPIIDVEWASAKVAQTAADNRLALLYVALAAGVGVVSGMGLISFGTSLDPLLTSVESVEAALAAPVVGVVTASKEHSEPSATADHQWLIRTATIIGGLLVITLCMAAVVLTLGMR